ncbi:protein-S-isoprenylcysteine O-methyltransferase [Brasilonema octagenarum]|uniref:Isoprenylcysteine carboxylmethyltransferase family protein n=1 Tax=Brasilonema octagenarum UFV-OR1 TaxID=417115 RepID=A0ABX1MEX2_9CYAN|nr:protein-S-isoprenylcysteine O-methyltransferase [Brasilonema octagenarum]NMF67192.1 isoprenylcysteine carboxylmethyltransferase family protein [Brasilonema octagenarum UFV-OR1]
MSEVTRKVIFLICFITVFVIRFYFARLVKQNKITDDRRTTQEKLSLLLTFLGMFILPLVGVFTPWLDFAGYNLPDWTGWFGTVFFVLAIWLFWRSHTDLSLNWSASLAVRENHSLVDTGVYRYIRHPMYAAFWLWGIAQALLLHNWIYGLSYIVSFVPMYLKRVPQEEQMMLDTFREQYQDYMSGTGRVIPKFLL